MLGTSSIFAQAGGSLGTFTGTNTYLDMGSQCKFTDEFTVEMWIWVSDWIPATDQRIISCADDGGFFLELDNSGKVEFAVYDQTALNFYIISVPTTGLSTGWHHLAAAYSTTDYDLYIDASEALHDDGGARSISYNPDNHMLIGAEAGSGSLPTGYYFNGLIDEVRIWNKKLSLQELDAWMNKPIVSGDTPAYISSLHAYYKLDASWPDGWLDDCSDELGGTGDYDLSGFNVNTSFSDVPMGGFPVGYRESAQALWRTQGFGYSDASNGFSMQDNGNVMLTTEFVAFANNGLSGTSTADLSAEADIRAGCIWYIDDYSNNQPDLLFDCSEFGAGELISAGTESSNYKLLVKSESAGDFSVIANATSVDGNQILFADTELSDGYYSIGRDNNIPSVITHSVTNVGVSMARCGGEVTNNGGASVTVRGVCWNTTGTPTIGDATTNNGSGTGVFISNINGLTQNMQYFVRAYATNSEGTSYGNGFSFSTLAKEPSVQASEIVFTNIKNDEMTLSWISGNGTKALVCMTTGIGNATPMDGTTYIGDKKFGDGSQLGDWFCVYNGNQTTVTVSDLQPATGYLVRIFEYGGDAGNENYYSSTAVNNPNSQMTELTASDAYFVNYSEGTDGDGYGNSPGAGAWKSIQYALNNVSNPDSTVILINISGEVYNLDNTALEIDRHFYKLTLAGNGAGSTIIQPHMDPGMANSNIININNADDFVELEAMTLRYGNNTNNSGGAIYNNGVLSLTDCIINNCSSDYFGGAIYNNGSQGQEGTLTMTDCTINDNSAPISINVAEQGSGGAIYNYLGSVNLLNCTFHNNLAYYNGGGIYSQGTLSLTNCTIAHNELGFTFLSGGNGAGVFVTWSEVYIKNSIIADNTLSDETGQDFFNQSSTVFNNGNNIVEIQNSNDFINGEDGCLAGEQSGLGLSDTLSYNGSLNQTETLAIDFGSVAIMAGSGVGTNNGIAVPPEDQRGYERMITTDIGSFEYDGYVPLTWTGSSSAEWGSSGNWNHLLVPDDIANVTISTDASNSPYITSAPSDPANCHDLVIEAGAGLFVYPGKALTINGNLTVEASRDGKSAGTLTVMSDATGTGSLIVEGDVTGNINFERYVSDTYWHFVSSPVTGQAITEDWLSTNNIVSTPGYQFYRWDEDLSFWIVYGSEGDPEAFTDTEFVQGRGYAVERSDDGNLLFLGNASGDTVRYATTYTANRGEGFNLLGNPFASAIAINETASERNFLADNSEILDNNFEAIFIWNEQGGFTGIENNYQIICNAGFTGQGGGYQLNDNSVQPGQAFMVKVVASNGVIIFNPDIRQHSDAEFYKSGNEWPGAELSIRGNGLKNSAIIAFNNEMSIGLDPSYDVAKIFGNPDLSIYSQMIEYDGLDYAVQSLPLDRIKNLEIPLGIETTRPGTFEFSLYQEKLDGNLILLEDRQENMFTDMRYYTYNTEINYGNDNRFFLHFKDITETPGDNPYTEYRAYLAGDQIYVENPNENTGNVFILNIIGQEMQRFPLTGDALNRYSINLKKGAYIITVITTTDTFSTKVIMN